MKESRRDHFSWKEGDLQLIERADKPPFPVGGVLVLGSDWGGTDWYYKEKERLQNGSSPEGPSATWRGLNRLFKELKDSICTDEIFLTNAWPCLRNGNGIGGIPPGAQDEAFTKRCRKFFRRTLEKMKPRLILPLGLWPTAFVASCFEECPRSWLRSEKPLAISTWKTLDPDWKASVNGVAIVPIVHPSMPNLHHRPRFRNMISKEAFKKQADLIRKASPQRSLNGRSPVGAGIVLECLRLVLRDIEPYPESCRVCGEIRGTDFFPGSAGLWCPREPA